jgi:hypothetical protein
MIYCKVTKLQFCPIYHQLHTINKLLPLTKRATCNVTTYSFLILFCISNSINMQQYSYSRITWYYFMEIFRNSKTYLVVKVQNCLSDFQVEYLKWKSYYRDHVQSVYLHTWVYGWAEWKSESAASLICNEWACVQL